MKRSGPRCAGSPASPGEEEWTAHDRWMGPFKPSGGENVFRLTVGEDGDVWITTASSVYRVDPAVLMERAEASGLGHSTRQWRRAYEERVRGVDWRARIRLLAAQKKFSPARKVAEQRLDRLGPVGENSPSRERSIWSQAMLYRAFLLGCMERWDQSLDAYAAVRKGKTAGPAAREIAAKHTLWVLVAARRWEDLLKEMDAQKRDLSKHRRLRQHVMQARRKINHASD